MAKKGTMFSLRLDDDISDAISEYAKREDTTKAAALNHYARIGVQIERDPGSRPATRADLVAMRESLEVAIVSHPIEVQPALPAPEEVAAAVSEERRKIARMGYFERRRYLVQDGDA